MRGYGVIKNESSLSVKVNQDVVPTAEIKMEFELLAIDETNVSIIRRELEDVMRQIDNIIFGLHKKNSDKE